MTTAAGDAVGAFPWDEVMATGLGRLRLSPKEFWAMTPREFERAASVFARASAPLRREELAALMRAFPDNNREVENGGERHGQG